MNFRHLWDKYKDLIPYAFFGVCTTLVNVISYWFFAHVLRQGVMLSTIFAWILAVLFAYVTNRRWVFHSEAKTSKEILKEIISFFGCRLATGILDWACMFIFVKRLEWNDVVIKIVANILVIIINYIASKFVIFKKQKSNKNMNNP